LAPGVFERGGKRHFRRRDDGIRHRGRITSGLVEAQLKARPSRAYNHLSLRLPRCIR
jgi:hypothetical protein